MEQEFPSLEERDYQKKFLSEWWAPTKLFVGGRQRGKSEMMLSELRRFNKQDFDCMLLAPNHQMLRLLKERYQERFGERFLDKTASYEQLRKGNVRGYACDVVIMDEVQEVAFEHISNQILPMMPNFIRASAEFSRLSPHHYLTEEPGFFDSVYYS